MPTASSHWASEIWEGKRAPWEPGVGQSWAAPGQVGATRLLPAAAGTHWVLDVHHPPRPPELSRDLFMGDTAAEPTGPLSLICDKKGPGIWPGSPTAPPLPFVPETHCLWVVPETQLQPKIRGPLPRVTLGGDLPSETPSPRLTTFRLLSSLTWTHCL